VIFRSRRKPKASGSNGNGSGETLEKYQMKPTWLDPLPPGELEALLAEIDELTAKNRQQRSPENDRRLMRLRHRAGIGLVGGRGAPTPRPEPAREVPSGTNGSRIPEIDRKDLTPELLRGGILQSGAFLVRNVIDRELAEKLAAGIDAAFEERVGRPADPEGPHYEEFQVEPPFVELGERPWIQEGGGVLAVDSPRVTFDVLEAFEDVGLADVIRAYIGERPALSANKSTLRRAEPSVPGGWHQDGSFLGDVRALNVWLSLSRCGDIAPGLDVVPRRIEHLVPTGTHGTKLGFQIADEMAAEEAEGVGIERPIFEPGDALLFDELLLHKTASDPSMPNNRYAVEAWFFGPSSFPNGYVPISY
jgi:hypothetical protein